MALVCYTREDTYAAARVVLELARLSPRASLVLDLTPPVAAYRARQAQRIEPEDLARIDRWMGDGDLDRAETLIRGVTLAGRLRGERAPPALRWRSLQFQVWRGRLSEPVPYSGTDDRCQWWGGLSAWARGDFVAVDRARRRLRGRDRHGRFRARSLRLLTGDGTDTDVESNVDRLLAEAPREEIDLARAIAVEALLVAGRVSRARDLLLTSAAIKTTIVAMVIEWLRVRAGLKTIDARGLERQIRTIGAHGITRWGLGRKGMYWIQSVPALLEIVRDAEDDLQTLSGACRWLVNHAGATRAAIVDVERTRLLAAEGWTIADLAGGELAAEAATPGVAASAAKYGSAPIGWVIARGLPDAESSLSFSVDAVAAVAGPAIRTRLDAIAALAARDRQVPELLGRSPAIVAVRQAVARAAAVPFPVLIEGESGTGKELVARALHRLSPRRDRRFCALNCAALADELVEAELFGHTRGAFTGAVGPRTGLFEDAHAGTLFMDEVSELSTRAQAKLLRAVQEREVRRVGENVTRAIDVRLIAATNRPLSEAVHAGRFRADLQFRLAVVRIDLPPLRERLEDVPVLAQTFWRQLIRETGKHAWLAPDALAGLCGHEWPGNVRELQNVVSSLVVLAPERGRVGARHVRHVLAAQQTATERPVVSLESARRTFERRAVATALARHAGRRTAAARELGLSRQGLTKALKRLGLTARVDRAGVA